MNPSSQTPWNPGAWKAYEARQQPAYDNPRSVEKIAAILTTKPPLVSTGEIERLQGALEDAAAGKRFVLQGGDCAECFADCTEASLTSKLKVLLQMSLVLTYATRKPTVRIGRIAGQYAKPRSQEFETVDGVELPVYRGDLVNSREPVAELRKPEPSRMLDGYHHAAASLNFIRALIEGGTSLMLRSEKIPSRASPKTSVLISEATRLHFHPGFPLKNSRQVSAMEYGSSPLELAPDQIRQ